MGTGAGTFVISWRQTRLDGARPAPDDILHAGSSWEWSGEALQLDGPAIPAPDTDEACRQGAARMIRRMLRRSPAGRALPPEDLSDDTVLRVTDGRHAWHLTRIDTGATPLLMATGALPPPDTPLWIVATTRHTRPQPQRHPMGGLLMGTRIATTRGLCRVETLMAGDRVITLDHGLLAPLWVGQSHLDGPDLFREPALRPIRFERDAGDLVVAPGQRLLSLQAENRALFNCDEVLMAATHMANGRDIAPDMTVRSATYVHLLLPRHAILLADGIATESLHPGDMDTRFMTAGARDALRRACPDPQRYGPHARRVLTAAQAAILQHRAA